MGINAQYPAYAFSSLFRHRRDDGIFRRCRPCSAGLMVMIAEITGSYQLLARP